MKRSETINELAAALAKAQKAFTAAERGHVAKVETKSGGQYTFAYADLAAYLEVCREPLGDNGLSVLQDAKVLGSAVSVTTLLLHSSGQWYESEPLEVPLIKDSRGEITPQIIGSGITYARRYSLSAVTGLASEADDDGNAASGNSAETAKRAPKPACPKCGKAENVIKGKEEYGGGWLCWKNVERGKNGCGHKWHDTPANGEQPAAEPAKPQSNGSAVAPAKAAKKTSGEMAALSHGTAETFIARIAKAAAAADLDAIGKEVAASTAMTPPDKDRVADAGKKARDRLNGHAPMVVSDKEAKMLLSLMDETGVTAEEFEDRFKVSNVHKLPQEKFSEAFVLLSGIVEQRRKQEAVAGI